jgi:hypothetical protein
MSKRFYLNTAGFGKEVMKADFMQQLIAETSAEIADKANSMGNGEYKSSSRQGNLLAQGMVWADDFKARKDDFDNNTLAKAAYPLKVVNK